MNKQLRRTDQVIWQWPINSSLYDRNQGLSKSEQAELENLPPRINAKRENAPENSRVVLSRLVQPIYDVFRIQGQTLQTNAVRLLLLEMRRRKRAFWGWSHEEWVETIGTDCKAFKKFHQVRISEARKHIMAVGYLLCKLNDITGITDYYKYAFAVRVFGKEVMEASLKRVGDALHQLGYTALLPAMNWHNIMAEALLINKSPLIDELTYDVLLQVRRNNPTAHA